MKNISTIKDCYGCGVCATICPKKIISIDLNKEGFYQPKIENLEKCINCGLCLEVCAFNHSELAPKEEQIHSYAAWSNQPAVRRKCSSGGAGFELGCTLIKNGYKVCGVKYNSNLQRAEHYIASTEDELLQSAGSKYIQSYTLDGFKAINKKEKYLVTGTPCQIDSFRRYIQKIHKEDNFILMDFFCHGVPSMLVWKKYTKEVEKITGVITYASWRNKQTGWHDSWAMAIDGEKNKVCVEKEDKCNSLLQERKCIYNSRLSQGDLFYAFFLGNMCLGKACYKNCKYKYTHSSADIRIGDLWGTYYKYNEDGVSAAIAFTDKGNHWLKLCNCTLIEHSFDIVAEGQIKNTLELPLIRGFIINCLQSQMTLQSILSLYKLYNFPKSLSRLPKRVLRKIKKTLKR